MKTDQCPSSAPIKIDTKSWPDYLTIAQAGALTSLSASTIRAYCKLEKFPQPRHFTPRKVFWRKEDVLSFIQGKVDSLPSRNGGDSRTF